jgi:hypothetical protein
MAQNELCLNADKTHLMVGGTSQRLLLFDPAQNISIKMENIQLEESAEKCEKLLGVLLQPNLKWSKHIQDLQQRLKDRLTGLVKIRYIVGFNFRKSVAQAIFQSVLTYCIAAWGGAEKSDLQDLQVMQNKAAQVVLNYPSRSHRETMYNKLAWLTVNQSVVFHSVLAVFQIRNSGEPEYLANFLKNDNYRSNIIVPNTSLSLAKKSFCFRGAEMWNLVPAQIRSIEKVTSFKKELKKWVLNSVEKFS